MTTRGIAGWVSLIVTVCFSFYRTEAWVNEALNLTALPTLVWAIVDWAKKEFPAFNLWLDGDAPLLAAITLSVVLPGGAYLTQVYWLGLFPFTKEGLAAAAGVGFTVANVIYNRTKKVDPDLGGGKG